MPVSLQMPIVFPTARFPTRALWISNCTIPFDENDIFVAHSQPSGERASLAAVSGRIVFFQKSDGKTLSPNSRVLVRRSKGSVACKSSNI